MSAAWVVACLVVGASGCTPVTGTAVPIAELVNQADLRLTIFATQASDTSFLQPGSTIGFSFTPTANLLELVDVDLRGSAVHFDLGSLLHVDATDVRVRRDPNGAAIVGVVDPVTGSVAVLAPVQVEGAVYLNGALVAQTVSMVSTALTGTFAYDPSSGHATLSDFHGHVPPLLIPVGPFTVQVDGDLDFNFQAEVPPPAVG